MGINIDGSKVTGITIDGQTVQEATVDGSVVWSAGSNPSSDTSMFSNPRYRWWAGSSSANDGDVSSFPEILEGVSAASVDGGNPTMKKNLDGYDAIHYDGNDYHQINENGSVTDPLTVVALIYVPSFNGAGSSTFLSWNSGDVVCNVDLTDADIGFNLGGNPDPGWGGNLSSGTWQTIGWKVDGNNYARYYVNGSRVSGGDGSIGGSSNFSDNDQHIGGVSFRSDSNLTDMYVAEIIVCSGIESDSNISAYHTDRVG